MTKIQIVGAIASAGGVTFYLADGKELNLKKDNSKTKAILDQTVDALTRKQVVTIDLDDFSVEKQVEKKSNGLLKFIRTKILGRSQPIETESLGTVELDNVLTLAPDEELTAVVETPTGKRYVPGVQNLERQMQHAVENDNVEGLKRFIERIGSVIDKRSHSMQELLNFMSRGDLPIADDGSIVAYKVLTTYGQGADKFVDCHSRNVKQQLGSHVSMPESLVDQNRRHECSTGLHIARRKYLNGFSGDTITIVKVAPEDVIAVPPGEPDKMRAAAYHIVAVLPKEVHDTLRSNRPMTGNETAAKLLADVIKGNHVGILEHVKINGPKGTDLVIEPVDGAAPAPEAMTSGVAKALDDAPVTTVNVRELKQKVNAIEQEVKQETLAQATVFPPPVEAKLPAPKKATAKKPAAKKAAKPKTTPAPKTSARPAVAPVTAPKPLSANHQKVLDLYDAGGKSYRQIEDELHVCRKTISKLIKTHRPS